MPFKLVTCSSAAQGCTPHIYMARAPYSYGHYDAQLDIQCTCSMQRAFSGCKGLCRCNTAMYPVHEAATAASRQQLCVRSTIVTGGGGAGALWCAQKRRASGHSHRRHCRRLCLAALQNAMHIPRYMRAFQEDAALSSARLLARRIARAAAQCSSLCAAAPALAPAWARRARMVCITSSAAAPLA